MRDTQALNVIVRAMAVHSRSDLVLRAAFGTLELLCDWRQVTRDGLDRPVVLDNGDRIVALGGLDAVVNTIETLTQDVPVLRAAVDLLLRLVFDNSTCKERLEAYGGFEVLMGLMASRPDDTLLQTACCRVFVRLLKRCVVRVVLLV
jgi:hypothetical protein